jgi:hypothetical protein
MVVGAAMLGAAVLLSFAPDRRTVQADPVVPIKGGKILELDGQAVYLGPALKKKLGRELLDAALDDVVAFESAEGKLYPILPTESGLFFYRDERVREKPMRIKARWHDELQMLEIIDRYSLVDGKANEIYYWCEICSIQMYHLKECDCCQSPIELREHPVGESFRLKYFRGVQSAWSTR